MMESKQNEVDIEQALLTWRNWSGERVNTQNKWVFRIILGLLTITITGITIWFFISRGII